MIITQVLALTIATAVPLVALWFIYKRDLYSTGSFRWVISCFLWGAVAFAAAYGINRMLLSLGLITIQALRQFYAPIIEEILKALILIYLVRQPRFTYFVDGTIYGFTVGIGFAIVENYSYVLGNADAALSLAIGRVLSTNLMHATACALTGIALGLARFEGSFLRWGSLVGGWLPAIGLHIGFNNLVTRVSSGLLLLYAAAVGFGGAGLIWVAIRIGTRKARYWIKEHLGEADRVERGEVDMLDRLDQPGLFQPIAEQFGAENVRLVKEFLMKEARLGINREQLKKLKPKERTRLEAEMAALREEINDIRKRAGAQCMLFVRMTYSEYTKPLWHNLATKIEAQAAARPANSGPSWMDTLSERTSKVEPNHSDEQSR
jgi:RsiW-degrading membrane proteinase PrsW (M82 family)